MAHPIPVELREVLKKTDGLSASEVEQRRERFGANDILIENRHSWVDIAKDTAKDPMIWFLAATSVLFFAAGDVTEGAVMALALLPILGMDAYLHRRTQASTAGLAIELSPEVTVTRDGRVSNIPAVDLVPGDRVIVRPGQSFPADGRILAGDGLQVDESILTGESIPVAKVVPPRFSDDTQDAHWVMAGTRLLTGEATFQTVLTGAKTAYGEIVRTALLSTKQPTQLQMAVNQLVYRLTLSAVALCLALGVIRYWSGHSLFDAVMSAITLAVAALPEEFPVAFSFLIAVGVYRMAQQKALVRRAVAVENIGRVTCICTDKTGTVTEGKLRVGMLSPAAGSTQAQLLACASCAARADSGDPLDTAILAKVPATLATDVAVFPFTEDRRRETIIRQIGKANFIATVKGAPETVLGICKLSVRSRKVHLAHAQELASQGYKVIGFAEQNLRRRPEHEPHSQFVFQGFVAFEDPVRREVPEAMRWALSNGVKVIMVTGDHAATARVIALKAGIGGREPRIVSGDELNQVLAHEDPRRIDVVARAKPIQKLELVQALQSRKDIVVVTGDGVNDVPALSGADVGVAMGQRGSQPARETAAIVLLNDSFSTIVAAIKQGRQIFSNLRLSFAYLLLVHIPLVLAAAVVPFLGYPLLFVPVHIVLLELIMHPTAILGFHELKGGSGVSGQQKQTILTRRDVALIAIGGMWLAASVVGSYLYAAGTVSDTAHGRAIGFATLVMGSSLAFTALSGIGTGTARILSITPVLATVVMIQWPEAAHWFQFSPLHVTDWLLATALALPLFVIAHLLSRTVSGK
jgi:P-type Ca2+ transporter type 2C